MEKKTSVTEQQNENGKMSFFQMNWVLTMTWLAYSNTDTKSWYIECNALDSTGPYMSLKIL